MQQKQEITRPTSPCAKSGLDLHVRVHDLHVRVQNRALTYMSVCTTYMSVCKCLFITSYKSVSYKAFFSHYIFLDSFFLKKKLDRKKNKKKGFGPFLIFFLKTTSPKRNDISPDLIPEDRQQQSSKQGERPGRGVEYRARAPGDQGERAAKAQASALE